MFFKSFYIRRLGQIDLGDINAKLARKPFVPCGTEQAMSMGFVPVFDGTEELAHEVNGKHWIRLAVQKKVVPASAVREELENRVKSIESEENRKVSKREQKDLRENIEFETTNGLILNGEFTNKHSVGVFWAKNWGYFYDEQVVKWRSSNCH